jgi:hypothetical protein
LPFTTQIYVDLVVKVTFGYRALAFNGQGGKNVGSIG